MTRRAVVIVALAASVRMAHGQQPVAPKLGSEVAPTAAHSEPAQALPSTVTICVDRASQQCWTALGSASCLSSSRPTAEVFATVPADAPEEHLLACIDSLGQ
jgi:hypothetical protein